MYKRTFLWTFILIVALSGLLHAQEKLTITVRVTAATNYDTLQQIVDEWGADHNVKVEILPFTGAWGKYYESISIKVASGIPVDIAVLDMQAIGLGANGVFVDLTSLIQRDALNKSVIPVALEAFTIRGRIYGFPTELFPNAIYYNQELFDKAGLGVPPSSWDARGWTWDDYATAAKRLTVTASNGKRTQWGSNLIAQRAPAIIESFGGKLVTQNMFNISDPGVGKALEYLYRLIVESKSEPQKGEEAPGAGNPFPSGVIGMQYTGTWMSKYLVQADPFKWNIGVTPMGVKRTSEVTISAMGIGANCQNKELAWSLIRYLATDPKGSRKYALGFLEGVPTNRTGQIAFTEKQEQMFPGMHAGLVVEALNYAVVDPFRLTINFNELTKVRTKTLDAALAGTMPLVQALETLKAQGDPILKTGI